MALVILNLLLALSAVTIAYRFGDRPEQQGAAIIIAMLAINYLGMLVFIKRYATVDPVACLVDGLGFLGFAFIGIYSKRIWPLWASSFQLLSVGAHFIRALELPIRPIVYAWMKSAPTWAVLLLLIGGTLANRQRARQSGSSFLPN
jgi:hypothetical protein